MTTKQNLQANIEALRQCIVTPEPGLNLCCISGPGGVGKSYLFNEVLRGVEGETMGYLRLAVDGGAERTRTDFAHLIDRLVPTSLPPPAGPSYDYFPNVRKVLASHRTALAKAVARLDQDQGAPAEVRSLANVLLQTGRALNKNVPISRQYLDIDSLGAKDGQVDEFLNTAWNLSRQLHQSKGRYLPGTIRDVLGLSFEDRVCNDLYGVVAEGLYADLCAALHRYLKRERFSVKHDPIPGLDKLLLVFDDYEVLEPLVDEFMRGSLLPLLAKAPFSTVVVLLCRDDVQHRNVGWSHQWAARFKARVGVEAWSCERAQAYLASQGVPASEHARIISAAEGMPFLLGLMAEEFSAGNQETAVYLKVFYERTTRWLTEKEKDWLARIAYLDEIDLDTLEVLFEPHEADRVHAWFEQEASLRDPRGARFVIRPIIKRKVQRYLELCSPRRHRELVATVAAAFPSTASDEASLRGAGE